MANITATFIASFDSFYDAVDDAVVKLSNFNDATKDVDKALQRMGESFSGRKVIQDATLMVEAISQIGGVSKLTETELQRVGATVNEAADKMKALGKNVPAAWDEVLDATKKVTKANDETGVSFSKLVGAYVTGEAIIGAVTSAWSLLVDVTKQGIVSAQESEKVQAKLTTALRAQGTEVPSVQAAYAGYANALEQTTIHSGDAIKASEAMLVLVGNVMPRDMEKALQATTNLADGLTIDLASATHMVSQAAEGNVGALKKQGVTLDENRVKTEGFNYVLDEINKTMAGQSAAAASTYEGRLKQLANAWDNVLGSIGRLITQNTTLLTAIDLITKGLRESTGEVNSYQTANDGLSSVIIGVAKTISLLLTAFDYLQSAYQHARTFTDKVAQGFISLGIAVREVDKAIYTAQSYLPGYGESATKAAAKAGEAIDVLKAQWQGLQDDQDDALSSAKTWSAGIGALNERIDTFTSALEKTRGQTTQLTPAVDNAADAWERHTRAAKNDEEALARHAAAAAQNAKILREEEARSWKARADMLDANGKKMIDEAARQYQQQQTGLATNLKIQEDQERASWLVRAKTQDAAGVRAMQEVTDRYKRLESTSTAALNNIAIQAGRDYDYIVAGGDRFSKETVEHFKKIKDAAERTASGVKSVGEKFNDAFGDVGTILDAIHGKVAEIGAIAARTGQAILKNLGEGDLFGAVIAGATGAFNVISKLWGGGEKKKVDEARQALVDQAGGWHALNSAAAAAGVTLTAVLDAKKVKDYETAVKALQDAIAFQDQAMATLAETTQRYGFTIEELGPALARQELDKQAQQLFKDWEVLNAAGIDTIAITARMAEGINGYVNRAIAMGTEVPEAMRPMLEAMAANGQLLDANGNKIGNLEDAGISFSMTMSQGFQSLIQEVAKLTDAIARGLGLAVDQTSNRLRTMPRKIDVDVVYKDPGYARTHEVEVVYRGGNEPAVVPGYAGGTHGKFVDFGSESIVALHGREAVVPEGDAMSFSGGASGGGAPVIVNIDARGALFDDPGSDQRLADRIERALSAKHSLTHKRRAA